MKKVEKVLVFIFCFFISGCLFSSDEVKDSCIVGNFYVSNSYGNVTLLYKNNQELKLLGSGTVIAEGIDSIGHYQFYIFAKAKTEYFILDTATKKNVGKYNEYTSFVEAKKKLDLQSEMESTN